MNIYHLVVPSRSLLPRATRADNPKSAKIKTIN